jgi:hypothetical protein
VRSALEKELRAKTEAGTGEILALAEPYLWMDQAPRATHSEFVLSGIVKPPEGLAGDAPAPEVRRRLLEQAEALLAALIAAGWQPVDEIRFGLATETDRCKQTLDGTVVIPSEQVYSTLLFEVRLNLERYQPPAVLQPRART